MAFIRAIDLFGYRVMRQFCYIGVAVSARNISVDCFVVDSFTDKITYLSPLLINPAELTVFMAHKAIFLVSGRRG